ncbi:FAD synthetase family protein [Alteribacter aurantiacus]|uniref:FAD synthetase family protein n=1 Tax=Alteribacter aurantiacus TaxID=254410 RepID=UPI000425F84E|nr:FAD synthetase family protein [Alteribacter aurantiacus]
MKIFGQALRDKTGCLLAIGAFDGVHRGHQEIIRQTVSKSLNKGLPSAVLTFDPPPKAYFGGARVLTPIEEKVKRIKRLGVDMVIVARFDREYTQRTAYEFMEDLKPYAPKEIIVGSDFRFGKDRVGDIKTLQEHYHVSISETIHCDSGTVISSTRIRQLMEIGKRREATSLLGWP